MKTFKTPKGTELPLMDIRGKDYLQVAQRLRWFREEKPDWGIETEVNRKEGETIARATIRDSSGRIIATATKVEDSKGFADHTEKAETGSIGRALGLVGYGTQFAPELDEGERLADAPIEKKTLNSGNATTHQQPQVDTTHYLSSSAQNAEKTSTTPRCPVCNGETRISQYPDTDFYCFENRKRPDHKGLKIFRKQEPMNDIPF